MSDQIYGKVDSDLDPFKKILSKIPGFSGYMERQQRRDSDKILRDMIADRFDQQVQRVSGLQGDLINQGQIDLIDNVEAAVTKLRTFSDRVRRATRGYSGLFDAVKINEEELARLYEYDATMLDLVEEVARSVDNLEAALGGEGTPAAIRHLVSVAQQCIDVFDRREEVFMAAPQG